MNKSRKFSWSSSTPSHLVPFRVGIESEDSSQCCFCCCNFHLKKAAILIAFLDIFMQCTQMYRNGEVYFLISKCKNPMAKIVFFFLIFTFIVDVAALTSFLAGLTINKAVLILPILFRYVLSIIFSSLFILYSTFCFLFVDWSLKRPLIWLYRMLTECPSADSSITYLGNGSISVQFDAASEFDEERFSAVLDTTLFGLLCISLIQLAIEYWCLIVLRQFCEYLYRRSQERQNGSVADPLIYC